MNIEKIQPRKLNKLQMALNEVLINPSDKKTARVHLNKFATHVNGMCDYITPKAQNRLIKILQLSRELLSDEPEVVTLKSGIEKNWKAFQKTLQ